MTDIEKGAFRFLIIIDAIAIVIGMIAGPMGRESISIAANLAAITISIALVAYALYFWVDN